MSEHEYLHEWDRERTENACRYAGFPEAVINDIWEEKKDGFVFISEVKRKR